MSTLPWYKEGLNFKCTGCGKCCTGAPGLVFISQDEAEAAAEYLAITYTQFKIRYTRIWENRMVLTEIKEGLGEFRCVFLKENQCTIYPTRPKQCQTYPWWKENLNTAESWKLAAKFCEGINVTAPLIPYTDIKQVLECKDL